MAWETMTLTSSELGAITFDRFKIVADELERDVRAERPPFSEFHFTAGSLFEKQKLMLQVSPLIQDEAGSLDLMGNLIDGLSSVTSINWNGRTRSSDGAEGSFATSPTETSYNITFSLNCTSDWIQGGGDIINPQDCQPITPEPLEPWRVPGKLPEENFTFQNRVQVTSAGVKRVGDGMRNSSILTIPFVVKTSNADDTWATTFRLVQILQLLGTVRVNRKDARVLSWKRITRRYDGCAIYVTAEFLMRDRLYPWNPSRLLFEDFHSIQYEDNYFILVG